MEDQFHQAQYTYRRNNNCELGNTEELNQENECINRETTDWPDYSTNMSIPETISWPDFMPDGSADEEMDWPISVRSDDGLSAQEMTSITSMTCSGAKQTCEDDELHGTSLPVEVESNF